MQFSSILLLSSLLVGVESVTKCYGGGNGTSSSPVPTAKLFQIPCNNAQYCFMMSTPNPPTIVYGCSEIAGAITLCNANGKSLYAGSDLYCCNDDMCNGSAGTPQWKYGGDGTGPGATQTPPTGTGNNTTGGINGKGDGKSGATNSIVAATVITALFRLF